MSLTEIIVEGTLKPDGTLELDQKPNLSPGRVQVVLHPAQGGQPVPQGLAEVIDEIRRGQQARGFQGRSAEDVESGLREEKESKSRSKIKSRKRIILHAG